MNKALVMFTYALQRSKPLGFNFLYHVSSLKLFPFQLTTLAETQNAFNLQQQKG